MNEAFLAPNLVSNSKGYETLKRKTYIPLKEKFPKHCLKKVNTKFLKQEFLKNYNKF